jgi:hypothetical protein
MLLLIKLNKQEDLKMIKALLFIAIGAVGAYLYMNPGDIDGATEMLKQGVNQGATIVKEATDS